MAFSHPFFFSKYWTLCCFKVYLLGRLDKSTCKIVIHISEVESVVGSFTAFETAGLNLPKKCHHAGGDFDLFLPSPSRSKLITLLPQIERSLEGFSSLGTFVNENWLSRGGRF